MAGGNGTSRGGPLDHLRTIDDVRYFILDGYRQMRPPRDSGCQPGLLPLAVAEPAALIARAVEVSGPDGISEHDLRTVFDLVGADRYERGLALARGAGTVANAYEKRHDPAAGTLQRQLIFRRS